MQSISGINSLNLNSNLFTNSIENSSIDNKQVIDDKKSNLEFLDVMNNTLDKVNESQVNANNMVEGFIKGEDLAMHDVMLAVQESQMSMQLMLELRNKLYEAYQEVNRVQL